MKTEKIKNLEIKIGNAREEAFFKLAEEYTIHLEELLKNGEEVAGTTDFMLEKEVAGTHFMLERIHHLMVCIEMVNFFTEVNSMEEIKKGGEIFLLQE